MILDSYLEESDLFIWIYRVEGVKQSSL